MYPPFRLWTVPRAESDMTLKQCGSQNGASNTISMSCLVVESVGDYSAPKHITHDPNVITCLQNDKVGKVVVKYEAAIKEVDVKLSVSGGDSGKGPKQQKTEITIYTIRNGVVCPSLLHVVHPTPSSSPDELTTFGHFKGARQWRRGHRHMQDHIWYIMSILWQ